MKWCVLTLALTLLWSPAFAQDEDTGVDGASQAVLPGMQRGTTRLEPLGSSEIRTEITKPIMQLPLPPKPGVIHSDITKPIGGGGSSNGSGGGGSSAPFSQEQQIGFQKAVQFYRGIVDELRRSPDGIEQVKDRLAGVDGIDRLREYLGYRGEREGAINDDQLGQLNESFIQMLNAVQRSKTPQRLLGHAQEILSRPDAPQVLGEFVMPPGEIRSQITKPISSAAGGGGRQDYRAYEGPVDQDSFEPYLASDGTPIFLQKGSFYELQGGRFIHTTKRP